MPPDRVDRRRSSLITCLKSKIHEASPVVEATAGRGAGLVRASTLCAVGSAERTVLRGGRPGLLARAAGALALLAAAATPAAADVGVAIVTSNATPVAGGAAFAYTITLTNLDAVNPAVDVVMTDPLPPSVIFQNLSLAGGAAGSWSCTGPAVATNGIIECTAASVPASGVMTLTIVAQVPGNVASGVRTNTARAVAGGVANSASVQINIQVNAPLSVTKAGPADVVAGDFVTYLITLNNGGSSTALNVTISDTLPAFTSFVSLVGTGPFLDGCSVTPGNVVTCAAVDVPSGLHYLTLRVKTSPGLPAGNLSNTATITSAGTGSIAVGTSTTIANVTQ